MRSPQIDQSAYQPQYQCQRNGEHVQAEKEKRHQENGYDSYEHTAEREKGFNHGQPSQVA